MDKFKPLEEPIHDPNPQDDKRVKGKIMTIIDGEGGGYGFISSQEIPYERIFFHWSFLIQDTLRFPQLEEGMKVEFKAIQLPDKGWRAIKIKVIE